MRLLAFAIAMTFVAPTVASEHMASLEHFVEANGVRLRIWEKVQGAPGGKPIVVLAHGSATAGQESFDLQVAGKPEYSLMDALARSGFDVFAPDIRGFGRSTKPETGVNTEEARDDLKTVADYILSIRGTDKINLIGWSWGTQYAGLFVMAHPEKVARYVAYAQMHANSPDIVKRRERLEDFRKSPYLEIPVAGWKRRFSSMTPDSANDPAVIDAYALAAAAVEKKSPTGPHVDMATKLPMVDPARILVPTLMIHGEYDDVADLPGLKPFFDALGTKKKSIIVVPEAGHMAHLQKGHATLQKEIKVFLAEPRP